MVTEEEAIKNNKGFAGFSSFSFTLSKFVDLFMRHSEEATFHRSISLHVNIFTSRRRIHPLFLSNLALFGCPGVRVSGCVGWPHDPIRVWSPTSTTKLFPLILLTAIS